MNDFLFQLHSGVRWLVVLVTLVALVKHVVGLVQKSAYDTLTQRLMLAFSMLLSVQWLIGLILLIAQGIFDAPYRWEHAVTMTIAVAVSHMSRRMKAPTDAIRYRNSLIIVLVVLALVFVGVARLPQGWR